MYILIEPATSLDFTFALTEKMYDLLPEWKKQYYKKL
jgi:hypothetical protein